MKLNQFFAGKLRKGVLFIIDCYIFCVVTCAYYISLKLIVDSYTETGKMFANAGIILACILVARLILGVYNSVWRYTNTLSYLKLIIADAIGAIAAGVIVLIAQLSVGYEIFLILSPINCLLTISSRYCYRIYYKRTHKAPVDESKMINIAIVGAGQLGAFLANELLCNHQSTYKPLFFVDKDPQKIGNNVVGLKVYPEDEQTLKLIKDQKITQIFVAVANLDSDEATRLFEYYSKTKCKLKIYDIPVKDFIRGEDNDEKGKVIRDFQIEDLLFRKPMKINNSATRAYYSGKTILVTGGGGSIGSELCRQIAKCSPKKLIILDIYENNAYEIQQELIRKYGEKLDLAVEIASVRDRDRLDAIFNAYRPDIVFHAAAHKHVPLMEHSGCEAIKNNVMGTFNTADMAEKYGTEKFILISTDKAVNPTNIMGASKRMCEMVIQCRTDSKTLFMAVRFGNVLGSNGSVIPLFREQIKQGGPVTITDKRIIRYFMTIPEASQLVMQAGFMAKDGELFVLDMGKPVKIYDLAYNMIKLSGFTPNEDIKIEEIGLRPGEKLYEELLIKTEHLEKTDNKKIFIEKDKPLSREEVRDKLIILRDAVAESKGEIASPLIKEAMKRAVPTFVDPEEVNKNAERSKEMKMTKDNIEVVHQ
jgi:FlaA1/EpsC-like NDP-sugar epimerase